MKINSKSLRRLAMCAALAVPLAVTGGPVSASHSWNGYHWQRTTAELTIPVYDNVSSQWDVYLVNAVADWNRSTVINSPLLQGSINPKTCKAVPGTIQVCNAAYGRNGWLGLASISISGGHISQGTTKLNDTYYSSATYNTPAWRAAVTCQEIGHDYGLGHQDEDTSTDLTNSCMDYTNNPVGNESPDAHDYEQLLSIYNHLESGLTAGGRGSMGLGVESGDTPAEWGRAVRFDKFGRPDVFERIDGPGHKTITHVYWAPGEGPRGGHH